jgi:hypothetical protein
VKYSDCLRILPTAVHVLFIRPLKDRIAVNDGRADEESEEKDAD